MDEPGVSTVEDLVDGLYSGGMSESVSWKWRGRTKGDVKNGWWGTVPGKGHIDM